MEPAPADKGTNTLLLDLLQDLGARPAVSFLEGAVADCIQGTLEGIGLPVERDRYGNLIVHLTGLSDGGGEQPPIAFVAHMDHPGFEAVEHVGDVVIARALGGVPQACFSEKVPVQIIAPDGERLNAETSGRYGPEGERMVSLRLEGPSLGAQVKKIARSLEFPRPVVFAIPDYHFDGELIHMRALDDLAGCASILAALTELALKEGLGDVYGVFTRAEEVGLIGARLLAEEGRLPADTLVVSVEASRTLPGATIGEGPVIRVGDASFTFDAECEAVVLKATEELMERRPDFKSQRQLMSGGTCEASAFRYHGYRTTGIALPLGNYHNSTPEGGIGNEFIHLDDLLGAADLIVEAAGSVTRRADCRPWRRMRDLPEEYRLRLARTAAALPPGA